jgi:hypothetical protein
MRSETIKETYLEINHKFINKEHIQYRVINRCVLKIVFGYLYENCQIFFGSCNKKLKMNDSLQKSAQNGL